MTGRVLMRRIAAALTAAAVAFALLRVIDVRPRLPSLPPSLTDPVALAQAERAAAFLAWAGAVALLLVFLALIVRASVRRSPPHVPRVLRHEPPSRRRLRHGLPPRNPLARPYVLMLPRPAERELEPPRGTGPAAELEPGRPADGEKPKEERRPAIKLLGPLAIEGLPRKTRGLRTDCRLFLVYLALHPNGAARDELIAALWPDVPDQRARQRLYQAAADARSRLGDSFIAEGDAYRLDRERVAIDVHEFDQLLHAPEGQRDRAALENAFGLVRGLPLAGLDIPALAGEARRLTAVVVDLCTRLAQARLADGDAAAALAAAERGIELDDLNEELWRVALEAESVLGLRDAVVNRYETLCRLLHDRLGLEPQRETRSVYLQLLGQE